MQAPGAGEDGKARGTGAGLSALRVVRRKGRAKDNGSGRHLGAEARVACPGHSSRADRREVPARVKRERPRAPQRGELRLLRLVEAWLGDFQFFEIERVP